MGQRSPETETEDLRCSWWHAGLYVICRNFDSVNGVLCKGGAHIPCGRQVSWKDGGSAASANARKGVLFVMTPLRTVVKMEDQRFDVNSRIIISVARGLL